MEQVTLYIVWQCDLWRSKVSYRNCGVYLTNEEATAAAEKIAADMYRNYLVVLCSLAIGEVGIGNELAHWEKE